MAYKAQDLAFSTLALSIPDGTATSLTVKAGEGSRFPAIASPDYTYLCLQDSANPHNMEIVKVTAHTSGSDSFTITRGEPGSTVPAQAWPAGTVVELRLTVSAFDTKAEKAIPSAAGNVAELDSTGNLQDSGVALGTKADKKIPTAAGNVAELDSTGNLQDSGIALSTKANKSGDTYTGTHDFTGATVNVAAPAAASDAATKAYVDALPSTVMASANGVLAPHKNLRITRPSTTTVTITADELVLTDSSDLKVLVKNVNVTADITTTGANGLDTGTVAANTWYHIWIIYNGTTVAALLSTSSTAPTMPSGYTYKGYVGACRTNASSTIQLFYQNNETVNYVTGAISATVTVTTLSSVSLASDVPPTAKISRIRGIVTNTGTSANDIDGRVVGANDVSYAEDLTIINYAVATSRAAGQADVNMNVAQTVYAKVGGANMKLDIYVIGWKF